MKKIFILLSLSFFLHTCLSAQYFEAGIFAGVSNYQGDLTPNFMEASEYAPAFGAFGRYNFTGHLAVKGHFYKGLLKGSDHNAQITKGNRARNLSFQTDIYEVGITAEYNLINYNIASKDHVTTPYIFAGISGVYFNPQAELNGQWFDLQPLGTEGQGLPGYDAPYKQFTVGIPAGLGVKFNINEKANIGIELGLRYTLTDYLDDVSTQYPDLQVLAEANGEFAAALSYRKLEFNPDLVEDPTGMERGNSKNNDLFFFGGVTLSVNIGKVKDFRTRNGQPLKKKLPKMDF